MPKLEKSCEVFASCRYSMASVICQHICFKIPDANEISVVYFSEEVNPLKFGVGLVNHGLISSVK